MQIVGSFDGRFGGRLKHALSNGLVFACILATQVLIFDPKGVKDSATRSPKFCSALHMFVY
jgi:hypothetical protein